MSRGGALVTAEMEDASGRELSRLVSYPIAASDIRRWALAVYYPDDPPREFWDGGPSGDAIVAPEEFNPFAWMTADPPGPRPPYGPGGESIEAKLGIAEVALAHMLNGGVEIEYGTRMRPGDVITSVTSLAGYSERVGRLGPMLFTRTTARWTNAAGEFVRSTTNVLIRYGAPAVGS